MTVPSWLEARIADLGSAGASVAVGISVVMLLLSVATLPWFLCRLPEDYLDPEALSSRRGVMRRVLRNGVGGILLILGILMLVLPGQGLLTIIVALTMLDFPKKRQLTRRLLSRPTVLKLINSIRHRFQRPPLKAPNAEQ